MTTQETAAARKYFRIRWTVQEEEGPHSFLSSSWYGSEGRAQQAIIDAVWKSTDLVLDGAIEEVPSELLP